MATPGLPASLARNRFDPMLLLDDVWLEIIGLILPSEVLTLSRVSRGFRALLLKQDVWARVLFSVCRQQSLFQDSYPIDEMNVLHLQRAALAPEIWVRKLWQRSVSPARIKQLGMNVKSAPVTLEPVTTAQLSGGDREALYLVPGGRFLIAARSYEFRHTLELWDLGVVGKRMGRPYRMAEVEMDQGRGVTVFDWALGACAMLNGSLRIAASWKISQMAEERGIIQVFTVYPTAKEPTFVEAAALPLPLRQTGSIKSLFVQGDRLLVCALRLFWVWDHANNTCIALSPPCTNPARWGTTVFTNDWVALPVQGESAMAIWKTPSLTASARPLSASNFDPLTIPKAMPNRTLHSPWAQTGSLNWHSHVSLTSSPEPSHDLYSLDVFSDSSTNAQSITCRRYADGAARMAAHDADIGPPPFSQLSLFSFPGEVFPSDCHLVTTCGGAFGCLTSNLNMSTGTVLRTFVYQPQDYRTHVYHNDVAGDSVRLTLLAPCLAETACPASGRIVYRKRDPESDSSNVVHIADYLC